jgi:hypothetical protein
MLLIFPHLTYLDELIDFKLLVERLISRVHLILITASAVANDRTAKLCSRFCLQCKSKDSTLSGMAEAHLTHSQIVITSLNVINGKPGMSPLCRNEKRNSSSRNQKSQ